MLHLPRSLAPTLLIALAGCSGPGLLFTATQVSDHRWLRDLALDLSTRLLDINTLAARITSAS